MKRCIAGAALAFIVVSLCFAQAELPDAMKKSYIQLRPGVFDIGKITVEEAFLDKTFTVTELPDGSVTKVEYGSLYLENGLYNIEIVFLKNDKARALVTFHLLHQGETTFLHSVTAKNYETDEETVSTNMPEKYQFLLLLDELSEKGD